MPDLSFISLRSANAERQRHWCPDELPGLAFRAIELAGETGEALNIVKKIERERQGWRGSTATMRDLADELADVVICADLVAFAAGIDLAEAVRAKFNATSEKVGIPVFLGADADIATAVYAERNRCAAIARRKEAHVFDDCECLTGPDPETGICECSLEARGHDCLCAVAADMAAEIATEIDKLEAEGRKEGQS